jgi:hypothetical protein
MPFNFLRQFTALSFAFWDFFGKQQWKIPQKVRFRITQTPLGYRTSNCRSGLGRLQRAETCPHVRIWKLALKLVNM